MTEPSSPPRRVRVAQALALVALAASLVGAVGPAEKVRTTYSWPPETLPAETPERAWYTPLLLARHRADLISATVPCTLPPPLPGAERPTTVLATTRFPARSSGLAVIRSGNRLEVALGGTVVERVSLSSERLDRRDCAYRLRLDGARWSLEGGPDEVSRSGPLQLDPTVTGLFSGLDLRSPGAPSIDVTTAVHATRTTLLQGLAWAVALLAVSGALVLVSLPYGRLRALAPQNPVRRAWASARAPDAAVAAFLLVWWVFAPAAFDDGWVYARELTFSESRGFSIYYSTYGVNLPLDYWLEWLHHWLAQATPSLVFNRLPSLLCLAGVWVLCRFVASRALGPATARASLPLWTLASAFVVGAAAWGMTLRPEPVTALLVTGVAACMLVFVQRGSTAAVACAAALVALALSAHPAGIVSLAPVLVASPQLLRWVRPHASQATAIVAAALGLLATLLFVGADLEQRRADAQLVRTVSYDDAWRDEFVRYSLLGDPFYGTPLRRASVALIGLAVLAYVLRRRRVREGFLDFPAWTLVAALVLLVATPSKWPWHFGTLAGLTAIAVCCETARLRRDTGGAERWEAWSFLAVGVAALAAAWTWLVRPPWNAVDLRTLDWSPGVESWLPVARVAAVLPIVVLAAWLLLQKRAADRYRIPWRVASWTGLLVAVPVLAFTVAIFAADTAKTSSWTLGRQNLSALANRDPGCGLADDLLVPALASARPLPTTSGERHAAPAAWVPPPPVAAIPRFALGPGGGTTPWFELSADRRFGLFVAGTRGLSDRLHLEWGRHRGAAGVAPLGSSALEDDFAPMSGDAPWRFHPAGELTEPSADATSVRVVFDVGEMPSGAIAVTSPVTYESEVLTERLRGDAATLVLPNLLMYFPCVRQPTLSQGVAEPPTNVVSWTDETSSFPLYGRGASPFEGVRDLYDLERLSIADSDNPPPDVFVYRLEHRIPGAALVPPIATTS